LREAIETSLAEFQSTTGIMSTHNIQYQPSPEISTTLYRIIQESLTNISKHSAARQVSVDLQEHHNTLHLQIADDGQGFDPDQNTTGFGIQGMRERTIALGGQFSISSQLGQGCRITVSIPLPTL
jgi:signal transduction histidine kinase